MSLTSYRAAPPRANTQAPRLKFQAIWGCIVRKIGFVFLTRFGGDLLSHVLRRSTIGAVALNGRVRNGAGCFAHAMTTKPRKKHKTSKSAHLSVMLSSILEAKPGFYWIKSSLSGN